MGLLAGFLVLAQAPICLPGTAVCASSDGRGGVKVDATGNAQASPAGASASGQATGNANGGANADANAAGQSSANASSGVYYQRARGRYGTGLTLCPTARVGVWSGFKVGGCLAIGFRWEAAAFEMETQLLYGGATRAFDWTLPLSIVVPLANHDSLFDGPYLRFGGSPVGATFARSEDGGSFVRFGLFAGAGYELDLADWVAWRVVDLRLSFDVGTKRAMDDRQHWFDPGLQLGTGLVL
jgi:hypothetical protein